MFDSESGLFWAVFDELISFIYVFTSTWKWAEVPIGFYLFSLSHIFFHFQANTPKIHIYLATCYHFYNYHLFQHSLYFHSLRCELTPMCVSTCCSSSCLHVPALVKWKTCWCCPLHSSVWSIASWVSQHWSCHGISANPIKQTMH